MCPSGSDNPSENSQYDIFREEPDRKLLWLEVVTGIEEARKRLMTLASITPARYRLYDAARGKFIELSNRKSA
jgi:hypothetical protein